MLEAYNFLPVESREGGRLNGSVHLSPVLCTLGDIFFLEIKNLKPINSGTSASVLGAMGQTIKEIQVIFF